MRLEDIKGLGTKRIEKLKTSGITDPLDILLLFPCDYFDRRAVIDWNALPAGSNVIFEAEQVRPPVLRRIRRGLSYVKGEFESFGTRVVCTWFNQDYVYRRLMLGGRIIVSGKLKKTTSYAEISAPRIIADRDGDIVPIYKLPDGLNQKLMSEAVRTVLGSVSLKGYVSEEAAAAIGIMPVDRAIKEAHFPTDIALARKAARSAAVENLAYTLCLYRLLKSDDKRTRNYADHTKELARAIADLPFELTRDQRSAIEEIVRELNSDERMNILLQGDVGSGKTIVAFLAAYYAALCGYQTALMAPTEILARQHYAKAREFFADKNISVACLTGSTNAKERSAILDGLSDGSITVAVGTHALTGKNVRFRDLGLTVTDEQHRFGVCQRGSLENKAGNADNLVMSATPIPRTLALSLYGKLKTADLRQKPSSESCIMTAIVPESKLNAMYGYIADKARSGEKTYIVCPRIDSEDGISASALYAELSRGALRGVKVGLLHGRMSAAEKETAMNAFAFGDTSVLVCTTVVEVGIDVGAATTMAIFGADRLGLSQLHQLRGRIGRRGQKSYCFIVQGDGEVPERLRFLCGCSDGFALAEYDFDSRGAGDFLGTRQHGTAETFAGVKIDADMLRSADKLSSLLLADPDTVKAIASKADGREEFIRSLSLN